MSERRIIAATCLVALLQAGTLVTAVNSVLPVRDGRPVVATVDGEPISLDEFGMELDPSADRTHLLKGYGRKTDFELLDRLINVRLIAEEAAAMGLADIPEIRKQVEVASRAILREVLLERLVKDVTPDPAAVEKVFRELVREWKTTSLLFEDETAARRARAQIDQGRQFDEVAIRAIAEKQARTEGDDTYHRRKDYLPEIGNAVAGLDVGQVSPVIRIQAGFVLVRVADIRYPENPEARAEARKRVLSERQLAVLEAHEDTLRRQYAVVNKAVLDGLDYEAERPGVDALLTDTRVVAEIKGAAPVTVGDLTDYLRMQFFHGSDQPGQRKRMNARKEAALEATLGRRLLNMEALRLGIDKTHAYNDRVIAFERSLVFDSFVQKVIAPHSKVREEEIKQHYGDHAGDYAYPEMLRVRSLAFTRRGAAERAAEKLRGGADFGWVATNADDQVDRDARALPIPDGQLITFDSMPQGMREALTHPRTGEVRLYAAPENQFFVLAIQDVIAPATRPYDEVKGEIAKKVYGDKVKKSMDDYIGKLRAVSKIEIHLKRMP